MKRTIILSIVLVLGLTCISALDSDMIFIANEYTQLSSEARLYESCLGINSSIHYLESTNDLIREYLRLSGYVPVIRNQCFYEINRPRGGITSQQAEAQATVKKGSMGQRYNLWVGLNQNWQQSGSGLTGDFDSSGKVDFADFGYGLDNNLIASAQQVFQENWQQSGDNLDGDLNVDGKVNFQDFQQYLDETPVTQNVPISIQESEESTEVTE